MRKVGICQLGYGNCSSLRSAIERVGCKVKFLNAPDDISEVDVLVLPGVGNFNYAMQELASSGMLSRILQFIRDGNHVLGICLGFQILFAEGSEGGDSLNGGVGIFSGSVQPISENLDLKGLTHKRTRIEWAQLNGLSNKGRQLLTENGDFYYFAHSYLAMDVDLAEIDAWSTYAGLIVPSMASKESVTGVQFHPELSAQAGRNFLKSYFDQVYAI